MHTLIIIHMKAGKHSLAWKTSSDPLCIMCAVHKCSPVILMLASYIAFMVCKSEGCYDIACPCCIRFIEVFVPAENYSSF